ncbi:MAG: restriction endonuclease subunit S, partial [Bacteroidales bacterium]|nr:restriction endonuclease subunit S [Bacteroidales bacterium]
MDTKKLRQKILDLAIHGKLVPQDPNDEPASVLLERIRAEKEQLIKEGKIKAPKKSKSAGDTSHYQKEVPFEVPEGWVWTTIGDILINRDGERIPVSSAIRKKQNAKLYDYYGAAGVIDKVDDYLFNERLLLVGEDGANLLSRSKDNAFFAEGKYWVNNHAHIIDASDKRLLDYIALYVNAIPLDVYVTGSAQPKLNQDNLNRISVPLPPLAEQFRIVQTVEECKRIVNGIENNQVELQETIDHTKQKILSLAIAGKLVSQDPSDEPAIVLMKRINPAFQTSHNLHYQGKLPNGWTCATFDDIFDTIPAKPHQV